MGLSALAKNNMLNCGLANVSPSISITYAGLFTGDPDPDLGTQHEVSLGTPTYARKSVTWNTATTSQMTSSNAPVFDVAAGTTVTHVGFFSAVTAGTYFGMADVTDEVFGAQGTYTLTSITASLT